MSPERATEAWCQDLFELLRIPSVSADPAHAGDVRDAARWTAELVRGAGGDAEVLAEHGGVVVGEIPASTGAAEAPDVLVYGHVDVQPPGPAQAWDTPPFEPVVDGEWIRARGAADDKGNLYLLLKAAALLAADGALPVNVRVLVDTEEEVCGTSAGDVLEADAHGADACLIFDAPMLARDRPVFCLGSRGNVHMEVTVRTAERDLHSGVFGGAAANAVHVLAQALASVVEVPPALHAGAEAPTREERDEWARTSRELDLLAREGALPLPGVEPADVLARTFAATAVDVTGIVGGEPEVHKAVVPSSARAFVSVRLAPGQAADDVEAAFRALVAAAVPSAAELAVRTLYAAEPSTISPDAAAVRLARAAFARSFGVRPTLLRTGGTLPILSALAARGIPTVLTGFDVPEGNIHAPNERFLLAYLGRGIDVACHLFASLRELERGAGHRRRSEPLSNRGDSR